MKQFKSYLHEKIKMTVLTAGSHKRLVRLVSRRSKAIRQFKALRPLKALRQISIYDYSFVVHIV